MGHYCYFCGESKPNEAFSGKGHRQHLCRDCRSIPAAERKEWELFGRMCDLMDQSRISKKNVAWLRSLLEHSNESIRENAQLILSVTEVAPYRKKRYQRIAQHSTKLLEACVDAALLYAPEGLKMGPCRSVYNWLKCDCE
jgi:methylphosphotriester-DNA--protein-cysteine methyltransferase